MANFSLDREYLLTPADCDATSVWLTDVINYQDFNNKKMKLEPAVPVDQTTRYINSLLPSSLSRSESWQIATNFSADLVSDADLFQGWAQDMLEYATQPTCVGLRNGSSICSLLDFPGDPDVSGEGMIYSYYIAAVAATIYFLVLTVSMLFSHRRKPEKISYESVSPLATPKSQPTGYPQADRVIQSFQQSLNDFLDTALVFAIAMLGASIRRYYAYAPQDDPNATALYQLLDAAVFSNFSVIAALLLQTIAVDLRTPIYRSVLWIAVFALRVAVAAGFLGNPFALEDIIQELRDAVLFDTYDYTFVTAEARLPMEATWERFCEPQGARDVAVTTFQVGSGIILANGLWASCYVVYTAWIYIRRHLTDDLLTSDSTKWKLSKLTLWALRAINGCLCCGIMWAILATFQIYRTEISNVRTDDEYNDKEWSFGQVLALSTWALVPIQLFSLWIRGPREGLNSKTTMAFKVVHNTDSDESEHYSEKQHAGAEAGAESGGERRQEWSMVAKG
ncbi:hypothetical protein F4778DRAFT_431400 [Xylariomycetidae sp. FL2044]|nr:hypothetical protein F4778DRAFT_431400 [Xylariomycetidae sp. FL2044]